MLLWVVVLLGVAAGMPTWAADKPILVLDVGGHTAMVWKVLFSRDGKELLSVSNDKTIRVWDVAKGGSHSACSGCRSGKAAKGSSSPSRWPRRDHVGCGGFGWRGGDKPIYLLSLATGRIERVLTGHEDVILGLSFDADGQRLISGSNDQTARIWNVRTGKSEQVLKGHTKEIYGVTFSPDGRCWATASHDKTAAVWNVATGQRLATLSGHAAEVRCLAWSRDSQVLATASHDHTIRLWRAGDVNPPSGAQGNPGKNSVTKKDSFMAKASSKQISSSFRPRSSPR